MKKLDVLCLFFILLLVCVKIGELTEEVNQLKQDAITKHDDTKEPPQLQSVGGYDKKGNQ